jgi:ATP/maltotriose-dependent transcriptional regulator MalT
MSVVVGRERELAALEAFLTAAASGPASLLLEGEPGIGKTTLWRIAGARARERGYRVLSADPAEVERDLAFAALADLLRDVQAELAELPEPLRHGLEVALLRVAPGRRSRDQLSVGAGLLALLHLLAAASPVLVAVDDLAWLDEPSAKALSFAVRRLVLEPVGVLTTMRSGWMGGVAFAVGDSPRLAVTPLSMGAIQRLIDARLGVSFSRPLLLRLHATSGGNPFYAIELARALAAVTSVPLGDRPLPVPVELRQLVRGRLRALPPATRAVLTVVAALPQPTVTLVETVEGPLRAGRELDRARDAGLIELDEDEIRFTHPLLRSVHYADTPLSKRRRVHQRLAEVVVDLEEQAWHAALGATAPDEEIASALEHAAARARSRGAPETAAELLERARTLTPRDRSEPATRRTVMAADCHFAAGAASRARELLEPLAAALTPDTTRASVLYRLACVRRDDFAAVAALCEQALSEAGDERALVSEIERLLSEVCSNSGDQEAAARHARAALAVAEELEEPALLAPALIQVALIDFFRGERIREALLERATLLERETPGSSSYFSAETAFGLQLLWSDELDRARPRLERSLGRAVANGQEDDRVSLLFHLADLECRAGRIALADAYADEVMVSYRQLGQAQDRAYAFGVRALVDARRGRLEEARAAAREAALAGADAGDALITAGANGVRGFVELASGDPGAARAELEPLPDALERLGFAALGSWTTDIHAYCIEALLALGDLASAKRRLDQFEQRAERADRPLARALAARYRGLLAAAEGDLDAAAAQMEVALEQHARCPLPFELGCTLLALGVVHRRARRKAAARDALQRAAEVLDAVEARPWAEQARDELRRIGLRRTVASDELTAAEDRVVELVAAGLTNGEVATRLFMSVKTVERHLSHVYRKLDVRSRTELASRIATR